MSLSLKKAKTLLPWNLAIYLPICWNYSLKGVSRCAPVHFDPDHTDHWKCCEELFLWLENDTWRSLCVAFPIAPVNPSLFPLYLPITKIWNSLKALLPDACTPKNFFPCQTCTSLASMSFSIWIISLKCCCKLQVHIASDVKCPIAAHIGSQKWQTLENWI